jgi:dipeptidyl aminopeptidase/acylaminoacyl peptidase
MRYAICFLVAAAAPAWLSADRQPAATRFELTVDSIMRGPKLVGYPPSDLRWSGDSARLFFEWRRPGDDRTSTWVVGRQGGEPRKLSDEARKLAPAPGAVWDRAGRRAVFVDEGDIALVNTVAGTRVNVTRTAAAESSPRWAGQETQVTFVRDNALHIVPVSGASPGVVVQLFEGGPKKVDPKLTASQQFLKDEEAKLLAHVREEARKKKEAEARRERDAIPKLELTERQSVSDAAVDAAGCHAWAIVTERPQGSRRADVPTYVTESAYTEEVPARTKVGDAQDARRLAIVDLTARKVVWASLSGVDEQKPQTTADAASRGGPSAPQAAVQSVAPKTSDKASPEKPEEESEKKEKGRDLRWLGFRLSQRSERGIAVVRSADNKDRWVVRIDPATGASTVLDHEHDDAWVRETGTPEWLADERRIAFLAEHGGWMHVYTLDATAERPARKALTSGQWEVASMRLSTDRTRVVYSANETHPGERQVFTTSIDGGDRTRLTREIGAHDGVPSPDGAELATISSAGNRPPEVFLQPLGGDGPRQQVTTSTSAEWRSFPWLDPKLVTFRARDGATVHARLYTPEMLGRQRDPRRPGVVFIHGAGYLQNAHRYWSTYYREYMFHHLLASRGYVVLDVDYRASEGYGRDWRTAIYRHMGGKDLDDVIDGAKYLAESHRVERTRIGVYGGSYGGFLTLMAMFTKPDVFAAGAALRPVTDWAHYNHNYTSNILNVPPEDAEAYRRSSPIYFAEGLKGSLLICHGLVDTNVHAQDSVRLAQRLIELRKENWELSLYPVENHAFEEETSWADEYRRILKLFETHLRK